MVLRRVYRQSRAALSRYEGNRVVMMRTIGAAVVGAAIAAASASAQPLAFRLESTGQSFTPVHSYVHGELGEQRLFFCGITGFGLHTLSQPKGPAPIFAPKAVYNQQILMIDEADDSFRTADISHLSAAVKDALLVMNASAYQSGDTLYIYGGYGPNPDETDVVTKPVVTAIDLPMVRDAVVAGTPVPEAAFTVMASEAARTAGADIFPLGTDRFVLFGGANFIGDYPSHTTLDYKEAAHIFDLSTSATVPERTIVSQDIFMTTDLQRRDLNGQAAAVMNGGSKTYGFLVTGGVFKFQATFYDTPVSWMEGDTYAVEDTAATIKLNIYHSPSVSFFSDATEHNRIVLFGGITAYESVDSPTANFALPWSDIISECDFDGTTLAQELELGHTPTPITNAPVVLRDTLPLDVNHQVQLDMLPPNEIKLGTIYGGVRAVSPGNAPVTYASGDVTDVYVVKGTRGDLTDNGMTDAADLAVLLAGWGSGYKPADLNWDGAVDGADLAVLLSYWGRDYPG